MTSTQINHLIADLLNQNQSFVTATLVRKSGSVPQDLGAKLIVNQDGTFLGTIGGGRLEQLVIQEALDCLKSGQNQNTTYPLGAKTAQCCGGVAEVFYEVYQPLKKVLVFGAGHVGQAFTKLASTLPFQVHLFDSRPEWIDHPTLPKNIITHKGPFDDFEKSTLIDLAQNAHILIWTHLHDLDFEILKFFLKNEIPFLKLGLIGSQAKWQRFQFKLKGQGVPQEILSKVQCPIGLFKTSKNPNEIALSVAADLLKGKYETNTIMCWQKLEDGNSKRTASYRQSELA